jgi:membrane-associated protease RseP (regulator of RpoE activity)
MAHRLRAKAYYSADVGETAILTASTRRNLDTGSVVTIAPLDLTLPGRDIHSFKHPSTGIDCAMIRSILFSAIAAAALALPVFAQADSSPGAFGITVDSVAFTGSVFSPTLKTLTIKSVAPGFPAAEAGIMPGEQIVEVDGTLVAGSKTRDIQALMKKNVGETVVLRLSKPTGESHVVTLVAVPKSD